jgi:protein-disulfide isomerase
MERGQISDDATPPARWPWWLALLFCLAGLVLSILLEQLHFKVHTDPTFHSFCAIDRKVNCDIVARSPYAVLFGVPVAAWGIFGYALAALVSLWGAFSRRSLLAAGCGLYLAFFFVASNAVLGAVSALLVTAVCILCLASYAANLLFLACALIIGRGRGLRAALAEPVRFLRRRTTRALVTLATIGGCAVAVMIAHPSYWKAAAEKTRTRPTAPTLPHGIEPGGGHFIGAEKPTVTLVEYSDYECPYCRLAHTQLRALLERYPTKLRLVHRHYPLDQSCNSSLKAPMHENACFAAMIAECAGRQDRFWEANDYLFAEARTLHVRPNSEIAHDIGLDPAALEACLREEGPRSVAFDVDEGNRLGIQGTPTFFTEGKTYTGTYPPWLPSRLENPATSVDGGAKAARQ